MADKNLTIFQKLGKILGPDGVKQKQQQPKSTQRYNIGSNELLKTDNKAEYDKAKLQGQQNKYLSSVWKKVENGLFQQSINYETTRIGSYADFEAMEFYPLIGAAMDVVSEEATTLNDHGRMLNIYSDSKRVKGILEDLFFNRLDLHTSLPMFTRNVCKYGDNFVYLNIDESHGIIGAKQMPNYEMERRESGIFDMISGKETVNAKEESSGSDKVKFYWRGRDVEFNSWQIAHFRLLGDDRRLPYGTCLKSDSYIETKNGYKEIKDINIGDEVYGFDVETQERITSKILDTIGSGKKTCYKLSTKHNYVDVSEEHKILFYNKDTESFEYKNTLNFKIGDLLVINKEKKTDTVISINKEKPIDNKNGYWNSIDLIPNNIDVEFARLFGYLIGDGWISNSGNAVSIALSEHKSINERYINYLNKITGKDVKFANSDDSNLEFSQAICHSKMLSIILEKCGFIGNVYTKRIPSWVYSSSKEIRQSFLDGLIDADGSLFIDKWNCLRYSIELANELLIKDIKILVQSLGKKSGKISNRLRVDGGIANRSFNSQRESFYFYFYDSENKQTIKHDIIDRKSDEFILEPIISIEDIGEHETFDIYVENKNHNFYANGIVVHNSFLEKARRVWKQLLLSEDAMLTYRVTRAPERRVYKIFVGNIDDADVEPYVNAIADRFKRMPIVDPQTGQMDLRYNQLSNDQDFFIPVRSENAPNPIDTLPGASNLDAIADIEFLRSNLFTALRVPKGFLGFDEATGDGKNLALQDIRFSRTINKIQQSMLQELNKIAIIHLYILGFEEDLDNFTLTLNNPSTQAEMLKVEHTQLKVTLYKDAVSDAGNGFAAMSMTRGKREILGWSDDEIKQDLLEQRMEKAAAAELANSSAVIKHTGMFDVVDRIYGDYKLALEGGGAGGGEEGEAPIGGGGGGGASFGGGGGGGEDLDFGEEAEGGETAEAGAEAGAGEEFAGGAEGEAEVPEAGGEETVAESIKKVDKLLKEQKVVLGKKLNERTKKYHNIFINKLVASIKPDTSLREEKTKIYDKNVKINEGINNMISDIDKMLDE